MTRRGIPGWATVETAVPNAPMAEQRHPESPAQHSTVSDENQAQASNPMVFQKPNEPEEPLQTIAW